MSPTLDLLTGPRNTKWQRIGAQFNPIELIDFRIDIVQAWNTWTMNRYIGNLLDERFSTRSSRDEANTGKRQKYVIDLALESYLKEKAATEGTPPDKVTTLDQTFRTAAISNIKTFLFAGHDTTSGTISYAYYYLSKHPSALARLRAEHDAIFGPDPTTAPAQLKATPHLLSKLDYTTAVIKECLRLQSPASTVRIGSPSFALHDPATGAPIRTTDLMLWPVDVGLHRHPANWKSDPAAFAPERFLPSNPACEASNPAFAPFSKGPRNCIGQELAMLEARVILALTARGWEFEARYDELEALEGDGYGRREARGDKGRTQFGEEAWQVQRGTTKPRGGMPCRLRVREG